MRLLLLAVVCLGQGARFRAVDVYVDAADAALAAYQVEIEAGADVLIVGVEGGEPAAYREPPYYDPAALRGGRVILAAFTTDKEPPRGRIRVARLHFQEKGARPAVYRAKAITAAAPGGRRISIEVELRPLEGKR